MKFTELLKNKDGHFSTTGTIQFFSWAVVSGLLVFAVIVDRPFAVQWFDLYLALCVFGSPATKGIIGVLNKERKDDR